MEDDYNIAFDILTEAVRRMGQQGITKNEILPYLVDFTAAVAIAMAGEEAIRACILRMGDRIIDFQAGKFPVAR